MAGVRGDLELEASRALASIDQVERQLLGTAQRFSVSLASALDQLTDADVAVKVDTTEVEQVAGQLRLLDADQVDVRATVDGAEVDQLATSIDNAERGAEQLSSELNDVASSADRASQSGANLGATLAKVAATLGVAAILRQSIDLASDLGESASKAASVFGEGTPQIIEFGDSAATAIGLARAEAVEATATFGNLFVAMGLAQDEASELSPQIVTLGADLASFNNLEIGDALEKLRSGLVGEIEPLRALGINFNAAQVEAKALELGLAATADELDEGAKIQARWALIVEQSTTAAGDFERTSEGLANQQRILRAEALNVATAFGEGLLPLALELVTRAREDLLPALGELGGAAVPLIGEAFRIATPFMGTAVTVLEIMAPLLEAVATVVELIPGPVLGAAGAFAFLGSGMGPLPSLFDKVSAGFRSGSGAAGRMQGALAGLTSPLGLVTAGLSIGLAVVNSYTEAKRKQEKAVRDATAAFVDEADSVDADSIAMTRLRVESENQIDDLARMGLTVGQLSQLLRQGNDGLAQFIATGRRTGELGDFRGTVDSVEELREAVEKYGYDAAAAIEGNAGLITTFLDLRDLMNTAAKNALDTGVALGTYSEQEVRAAVQATRAADGTRSHVAALELLEDKAGRGALTLERLNSDDSAQRMSALREATLAASDAMAKHSGATEVLGAAYVAMTPEADALIERMRVGGLTAADYAAIMRDTGLSFEQLLEMQTNAVESTIQFQEVVTGALTTVGSALENLNTEDSLQSFLDDMVVQVTRSQQFLANITTLMERGADDLAAAFSTRGVEAATAAAEAVALGDAQLMAAEAQLQEQERIDADNVTRARELGADLYDAASNSYRDINDLPPPDIAGDLISAEEAASLILSGMGDRLSPQARWAGAQVANEFIAGLVDQWRNSEDEVVGSADAIARWTEEAVRRRFESESPSKVARRIGEDFVEGMAQGLGELAAIDAASLELANRVASSAQPSVPAFAGVAAGLDASTVAAAGGGTVPLPQPVMQAQIGPNYNVELDPLLTAAHLGFLAVEGLVPTS